IWYGSLFLRTTLAVSRRQEFAADVLAASLTSPQDVRDGLRVTRRAGAAFGPYMFLEYLPLLEGGYRLPLAEGFARFLRAAQVSEATEADVERELKTERTEEFDSHPSLAERLGALEALPSAGDGGGAGGNDSALSLLADIDGLELRLARPLNLESVGSAAFVEGDLVGAAAG